MRWMRSTGELGKLSAMFGGMPIYNAADTMFGRMSHPYKDKPPYDNEAADGNDESDGNEDDEEDQDVGESDEDRSDKSGVGASIDSKLDLLSQVLDSDQVKEQLPEAVLEQLAQKLDHWRSQHEESELEDDDSVELNRLLGHVRFSAKSKRRKRSGERPCLRLYTLKILQLSERSSRVAATLTRSTARGIRLCSSPF